MKHAPPGGGFCGFGGGLVESNTALQVKSAASDTTPPQPDPVQPENCDVPSGVGASAMLVPAGNCAWHAVPQSMPAGLECTVPMPVPPLRTVSVRMPPSCVTV